MSNSTIVFMLLFIVVWVYSLISIVTGEFREQKAKVFWMIGVFFVPFLAFFYLFMKKNLLVEK
ncbi:hypothetical protein M947_04670 [Sulfurimonas hongkongensis]|uniref:Cardiolipin synthase N-terminal domain-containing protein n=1 Tax=Sulfurimonas hongkongensis TaxID=1172190 RepID=T0JSD5_9BACT|nr:PLDc N-terminal domain-containing protein [Sulfurimonas hongkongensis]EQB39877.1 hypothetical protein M947_04670 [Sulfurimonas hongkongensis]